jgi:hypothetical protein
MIYELLDVEGRANCAHINSCFLRLYLQERYRLVRLDYPGKWPEQLSQRLTQRLERCDALDTCSRSVNRVSDSCGRDPLTSAYVYRVDLVVTDEPMYAQPEGVLEHMLSAVHLFPLVVHFRRPRIEDLFTFTTGLPNLSHLGLELDISRNPSLDLGAFWPTMAPRLRSLHIYVHGVASYIPLVRVDGGLLVQLSELRLTHKEVLERHREQRSVVSDVHPEETADMVCRVAQFVGGVMRTLKSLWLDLESDLILNPALLLQELNHHHFVRLSSLRLTIPGECVKMPALDAFLEQHAATLTSYHVVCRGLPRRIEALRLDYFEPLTRHVQLLAHLQTLSMHLPIVGYRPGILAATLRPDATGPLLTVLGAMPDGVRGLNLCTCPDEDPVHMRPEQLMQLCNAPAMSSSLQGTILGNLRSLIVPVFHITPSFFDVLALGLPLLQKLELDLITWIKSNNASQVR